MTTAAAVDLASRGLAVFPLPPGGRCPLAPWHARCLNDPQRVRQLWREGDNIGVGCRASGIVGLDLDRGAESDGLDVLVELAARLGQPWPETLSVSTPSGGRHLYFAAPPGSTIISASGKHSALGPGIDVRGPGLRKGGYLVGPGSVVGAGRYVIERDMPVAALPAWLASRLAAFRNLGEPQGPEPLVARPAPASPRRRGVHTDVVDNRSQKSR